MKMINEMLNAAIKIMVITLLWWGGNYGFYSLWVGY